MSKRPPEDNFFIDKILKELDGSVDMDDESKEAMKEALRDSMGLWFPNIGVDAHEPNIEILEGAKSVENDVAKVHDQTQEDSDSDTLRDTLRSQLHILEEDDLLEDDAFPNVEVRVLSPQDLLGGGHPLFGLGGSSQQNDSTSSRTLLKRGRIVLEPEEEYPLVHLLKDATYRISCEQGSFQVMVRCGDAVEEDTYVLRAGQSIDVDAWLIVLYGIDTSTGWYQSIQ